MRAALFMFDPPADFTARYLLKCIFEFMPASLVMPVAPTREFWMHVMQSKIEATIKEEGDMIGWESDDEKVGPVALAAKASLLRAIPHIFPPETEAGSRYRLVLEHGDFGIHNASIAVDGREPKVNSLYDWETGCIVPAILSDVLVAVVGIDIITNHDAEPAITRIPKEVPATDLTAYAEWARHYIEVNKIERVAFQIRVPTADDCCAQRLYHHAPDYPNVIRAGKDVRHLWFSLRDWRGEDPEDFFGILGVWAETRMRELAHE